VSVRACLYVHVCLWNHENMFILEFCERVTCYWKSLSWITKICSYLSCLRWWCVFENDYVVFQDVVRYVSHVCTGVRMCTLHLESHIALECACAYIPYIRVRKHIYTSIQCIHTCIYIYTSVQCMHICMYTYTSIHVCLHKWVCTRVCVYIYMYIHIWICVMYTDVYLCVYTYIDTYIYIYMYNVYIHDTMHDSIVGLWHCVSRHFIIGTKRCYGSCGVCRRLAACRHGGGQGRCYYSW
jgi:hypothetical protein